MIYIINPKELETKLKNLHWWQIFKKNEIKNKIWYLKYLNDDCYYNPSKDKIYILNIQNPRNKDTFPYWGEISRINDKWDLTIEDLTMTLMNHEFLHKVFHELGIEEHDLLDYYDYKQFRNVNKESIMWDYYNEVINEI